MTAKSRILIIKLGALGDIVLCQQVFASIRAHHPDAEIGFLTMPAFADFAARMPWFDRILVDPRPRGIDVAGWARLLHDVRGFAPQMVYDFQGKKRQDILYAALGGFWRGVSWSGAAPFCSHPRLWPPRPGMHYTDFVAAQIERAQVPLVLAPDMGWLDSPLDGVDLPERFALIIPGCAPDRLYKRWPAASYAALVRHWQEQGIATVAIGTAAEAEAVAAIQNEAPRLINLVGRTNLFDIAGLARRAISVVGNDTGPTHIAAAVGAPTVAIMSGHVTPSWSAPKGPRARWLQGIPIEALPVDSVLAALRS